jgi:hypothetical protein
MELELISDLMQCYMMGSVITVGVEACVEMDLTFFREVPIDVKWSDDEKDLDMVDHEFVLTFKGMWYAHRLVKKYNLKTIEDWQEWQGENLRIY